MNIEPFGSVSKETVEETERTLEFTLPVSYRFFLELTNGGVIEEGSMPAILVPGLSAGPDLTVLYGIGVSEKYDIVSVNRSLKKSLPPNACVIGGGTYGYFLLVKADDDDLLYFWDRELVLPISSPGANAYMVSESFRDFWNQLGIINIYEKGDSIMERIEYVPLGSIILLNGNIKKVLVISRGLLVKNNAGQELFFDYAGVTYPEGLLSDELAYFNHSDISKVIFEGYRDEEDEITVNNINTYLEKHPDAIRGNVDNWG